MAKLLILNFLALTAMAALPPKAKLSETGLYSDIGTKTIDPAHLSYSPQYPLWSDGAVKKRWISIPAGALIKSEEFDAWVYPRGTKIWKEFSFGKRVETRLMEKVTDRRWQFATYLWNADESEATLAPEDGIKNYYPLNETLKHDVPSTNDCQRCHRKPGDPVLGFDALQLSSDRDPNALHAEPLEPGHVTLATLIERRLLSQVPDGVSSHPPRIVASTATARATIGYLVANCGSCHNPNGSDSMSRMELHYPALGTPESESPVFLTAVAKKNIVFFPPGQPNALRIAPGDPGRSAFFYRMSKMEPEAHMPPIGVKLADTAAIELIRRWISELPR